VSGPEFAAAIIRIGDELYLTGPTYRSHHLTDGSVGEITTPDGWIMRFEVQRRESK